MNKGAWQASPWGHKELDMTEQLRMYAPVTSGFTVCFHCPGQTVWHDQNIYIYIYIYTFSKLTSYT